MKHIKVNNAMFATKQCSVPNWHTLASGCLRLKSENVYLYINNIFHVKTALSYQLSTTLFFFSKLANFERKQESKLPLLDSANLTS